MADLSINIAGVKSLNPFWLASAPPTNTGDQVARAFDTGWGGAVWKTLGEPIVNVYSRYGAIDLNGVKMMGLNNIELITDRTLDVNLREIRDVKRRYPKHALIVSLMVESKREAWHDIVKRVEDTGCDGLELNFGCPHGMSERGMGSAVGQVPEYACRITGWVKEVARTPVFVKLTPNVSDITFPGRAAKKGGADAISLINTINSVMGVDLDTLAPNPSVGGKSSHGGYCGPAVKPIALHMVSAIAKDPEIQLPISGIGGISTWRDAAEFMLLGATTVQVCTAVMHHGFRIVEDMIDGLSNWLDEKGFARAEEIVGKTIPRVVKWDELNLNYQHVATISREKCIECDLCYIACFDGAHQAIRLEFREQSVEKPVASRRERNGEADGTEAEPHLYTAGKRRPVILDEACVGCNLCKLVCPVDACITMSPRETGAAAVTWKEYTTGAKLAPRAHHDNH